MPSSKGNPTDPELREHLKEGEYPPPGPLTPEYKIRSLGDLDLTKKTHAEIKQEPNKSGDGKGQWAAWKGVKLAKEYERQGGEYEDEPGSKNQPKKGAPEAKGEGEY